MAVSTSYLAFPDFLKDHFPATALGYGLSNAESFTPGNMIEIENTVVAVPTVNTAITFL